MKGLFKIAELNRLQNNYPYVDLDLHQMIVATITNTAQETVVVGFCDVDARPCKTKQISRENNDPYWHECESDRVDH